MLCQPYGPAHGFQKLCSLVQWLWVFRAGQGSPCLTLGPEIISCKFGTDIFENMDTVAKTIFWSAQSGFKNIIQPTGFKICAHLRNGCGFSGQARDTHVWQGVLTGGPANWGLVSSKLWSPRKKRFSTSAQSGFKKRQIAQCWISLDCTTLSPP